MAHRITIPDDLGGGWLDIKEKRSWADSNRIEGAGLRVKAGLSQADIEALRDEGRISDLMEPDAQAKAAMGIAVVVLGYSDGLLGSCVSVREWLDSDELDEDLGDFLANAIDAYYEGRKRSKSRPADAPAQLGRSAPKHEGFGAA